MSAAARGSGPVEAIGAVREGRLADPHRNLATDPRTDPSLLVSLAALGFAENSGPSPLSRADSLEERRASVAQTEGGFQAFYDGLKERRLGSDDPAVAHSVESIIGSDGSEIALHIYRPADAVGELPCVMYLHGGAMVMLSVDNQVHRHWAEDLAATGLMVIAVDFRNGGGVQGPHPFPAGLNDCASALEWIHENRSALGVSAIVLQGDSGGANLALATALKAMRDGSSAVDGVYAQSPYISGAYGWSDARKLDELPSMVENDGYFVSCSKLDVLASVYDPGEENAENPLCWPYFAQIDELRGLPPHVLAMNELDPLRDEGVSYARKLRAAGVSATGRINLGITHAAESIFRESVGGVNAITITDIQRFAASLGAARREPFSSV